MRSFPSFSLDRLGIYRALPLKQGFRYNWGVAKRFFLSFPFLETPLNSKKIMNLIFKRLDHFSESISRAELVQYVEDQDAVDLLTLA